MSLTYGSKMQTSPEEVRLPVFPGRAITEQHDSRGGENVTPIRGP
jgi:hypothetical protein